MGKLQVAETGHDWTFAKKLDDAVVPRVVNKLDPNVLPVYPASTGAAVSSPHSLDRVATHSVTIAASAYAAPIAGRRVENNSHSAQEGRGQCRATDEIQDIQDCVAKTGSTKSGFFGAFPKAGERGLVATWSTKHKMANASVDATAYQRTSRLAVPPASNLECGGKHFTIEKSAEKCAARCGKREGCTGFAYNVDGGCGTLLGET